MLSIKKILHIFASQIKIIKMKTTPNQIALNIARLNEEQLQELGDVLNTKYEISSNLYKFGFSVMKSSYDVYLKDANGRKLGAVKCLKELLGIGLKEAKNIVEGIPCVVAENISASEVELYESVFNDAGITVEFL